MSASVASDNSLDRELALARDDEYEFRELENFENSTPDDSAQSSAQASAADYEEWNGISESEDEWNGINNDVEKLLQPPNEDIPYRTCETLLQQVRKHAAK